MSDKRPVIARIFQNRRMARMMAKEYMRDNKDRIWRVQDRGHFIIQMEDREVVFMTIREYEKWCIGKTYFVRGRLFHSGLPAVRGEKNGEVNNEQRRDEADGYSI